MRRVGGGGQGGCDRRSEIFVKIHFFLLYIFFFWGGGSEQGLGRGVARFGVGG